MAAFDFPNSPNVGDIFSDPTSGASYKWNGYSWVGGAGNTMGALVVSDNPPANPFDNSLWYESDTGMLFLRYNDGNSSQWVQLNALPDGSGYATIPYVDAGVMLPNRIINGDMRLDQRNGGNAGTASGYTADRWQYNASVAAKGTWQRVTGGPAALAIGFPFLLGFTSSSAYAPAAGEAFYFSQVIEADNISDFLWGTPNAQPVTLSFWISANISGTYSAAIRNQPAPPTRSFPFSFNVPAANTWTKIVITIPGDSAGSWVTSGNMGGLILDFDLGSGSTYRAAAATGAWQAGNFLAVTGAVSVVTNNGAAISLTGVKLELGSRATPFPMDSIAKRQSDCYRYYQTITTAVRAYATAANAIYDGWVGYTQMRAIPTVALISSGSILNVVTSTLANPGLASARLELQATAAGDCYNLNSVYSLTAEL